MKTMKKLWISVCSFAFAIAFGAGVATAVKAQPVQAEAENTLGTFDVGLNMSMGDLANNGVLSQYNSRFLYLAIEKGETIPYSGNWDLKYTSVGDAVKVNGVAKSTTIIKTEANAGVLALLDGGIDLGCTQVGDTLTIDGEFTNGTYGTFTLKEVTFIFDGNTWMEEDTVTYAFEPSTKQDANTQRGFYASMAVNHIPVSTESDGWQYWTDACADNQYVLTSGGVSTAFKGNLCKYGASDWFIGFRNEETGIYDSGNGTPKNGDTITLGGWFGCSGGALGYIKIANAQYEYQNGVWTNVTPTITVKLGETVVENDAISVAPGSSVDAITATCEQGNVATIYEVNAVQDGKFVLRDGENSSTYRATYSYGQDFTIDGKVRTIYFTKEMVVRVGFEDFVMEEGASVRVVGDNVNGLRFTAEMTETTYDNLLAQDATFGMIIVPRDYITAGYELTAENLFGTNAKYSETATAGVNQAVRKMLHLKNLKPFDYGNDGKYEIRGAITDILTNNLTREFVPVAYAKVGDKYILADYFAGDVDNNARSIYYVAQRAVDAGDNASKVQAKYIDVFNKYVSDSGKTYKRTYTVNYIKTVNGKSTVDTETFTAPLNAEINLEAKDYSGFVLSSAKTISSKIYANKENVFNFYYAVEGAPVYDSVAWYHPPLDPTNNYDNATNDAIAQTMKDAGFTTVILAGPGQIVLDSDLNIANTRLVIDMFYRNGIKSIVCAPNWTETENYQFDYLPDFSNHEGFAGFHIWDEPLPQTESFERILEYVNWYMEAYEDVEGVKPFIVNLNPSYAPFFNDKNSTYDYTNYVDYVQEYCDIVLSEFDGTNYPKFLSVDTYPIKSDGTLRENFLYDMAVLKALAMDSGAHTHIALQACGWDDEPDDGVRADYDTAPTEEQMRLQMYTALAFGADSISWWGYAPIKVIVDAPLDKNGNTTDVYYDIQAVNSELATFGSLYKNYTWQGVLMNEPSSGFFGLGADAQYKAYKKVKDESVFADYLLSAGNTSSFTSISGSGSNYIVSVMKNADGNEAFVAVNYSAVKDNKTLELTFKGSLGQYSIYKNGKMEMVTIDNNGYTLKLAPGEGAFIVEANSEHKVTFKNWDGTVLQEETLMFGSIPEYKGETPTKAHYKFTGWTPAIGAINGDTVYTALFEEALFESYTSGAKLEKYPTAIPMSDLAGKALSFDFKIDGDGSFGGAFMSNDWANVTGTLIISKNGNNVTANFGRITAQENGWYNWKLNSAWFAGDGLARATNIGLFYHQNVELVGTVHIDWNSFKAVDAYAHDKDEDAFFYANGKVSINENLPVRPTMESLNGKAIQIDFKMEQDGQFGFALNSLGWANLTDDVIITKSGNSVTANQGRIVALGDNWYAWQHNRSAFAGDGLNRDDATEIGIAYWGGTVVGGVSIDWSAIQVIDAFLDRSNAVTYNAGFEHRFVAPIAMNSIAGKAFSFDFKIDGDGSFGFSVQSNNWSNLTGDVTITKSGDSVTANQGRVVALADGWYSWQINYELFNGDGFNRKSATEVAFLYWGGAVSGTVQIDKANAKAVDAYAYDRTAFATKYTDGSNVGSVSLGASIIQKAHWNNQWAGFKLYFEFKFETDGKFGFDIMASDWANISGTLLITKSGDTVTANMGNIISLGDGWYAFEMNVEDFSGDGKDRAADINLIYYQGVAIEGTVWINWHFKALPTA